MRIGGMSRVVGGLNLRATQAVMISLSRAALDGAHDSLREIQSRARACARLLGNTISRAAEGARIHAVL